MKTPAATPKAYLTRADLLATLGLQDKSKNTVHRAIVKLAAYGCPKIKISKDGIWNREAFDAALGRMAKA